MGKKSMFSRDISKWPTLRKTKTECLIHINYKSNYSLQFLKICLFNRKLKSDFTFLLSLPKSATTVLSGWEQWQTVSIWAVGECWADISSSYMAASFHHNLAVFIYDFPLYLCHCPLWWLLNFSFSIFSYFRKASKVNKRKMEKEIPRL